MNLFSLFIVTLVLAAQKHGDELNVHRDIRTLELAILSEQKIAKVIQLLEELLRDSPQVQDRGRPTGGSNGAAGGTRARRQASASDRSSVKPKAAPSGMADSDTDRGAVPVLAARIALRRASSRAAHKGLLGRLGPGLITGASDDDPSGIATYSQTGAQFGYAMCWVMLFCFPLMAAIQEISARMGRTTGRGIAGNIRAHYARSTAPADVTQSRNPMEVIVFGLGDELFRQAAHAASTMAS